MWDCLQRERERETSDSCSGKPILQLRTGPSCVSKTQASLRKRHQGFVFGERVSRDPGLCCVSDWDAFSKVEIEVLAQSGHLLYFSEVLCVLIVFLICWPHCLGTKWDRYHRFLKPPSQQSKGSVRIEATSLGSTQTAGEAPSVCPFTSSHVVLNVAL